MFGCLFRVVVIAIIAYLIYSYLTDGFARIMRYYAWMHPNPLLLNP